MTEEPLSKKQKIEEAHSLIVKSNDGKFFTLEKSAYCYSDTLNAAMQHDLKEKKNGVYTFNNASAKTVSVLCQLLTSFEKKDLTLSQKALHALSEVEAKTPDELDGANIVSFICLNKQGIDQVIDIFKKIDSNSDFLILEQIRAMLPTDLQDTIKKELFNPDACYVLNKMILKTIKLKETHKTECTLVEPPYEKAKNMEYQVQGGDMLRFSFDRDKDGGKIIIENLSKKGSAISINAAHFSDEREEIWRFDVLDSRLLVATYNSGVFVWDLRNPIDPKKPRTQYKPSYSSWTVQYFAVYKNLLVLGTMFNHEPTIWPLDVEGVITEPIIPLKLEAGKKFKSFKFENNILKGIMYSVSRSDEDCTTYTKSESEYDFSSYTQAYDRFKDYVFLKLLNNDK